MEKREIKPVRKVKRKAPKKKVVSRPVKNEREQFHISKHEL
jgi:hypothetical protein